MEFEKACSEVYFILINLKPEEREKIPDSAVDFFKNNRDLFYEVKIDIDKPLEEQKLREETKAFLHILHKKYFENNKNL